MVLIKLNISFSVLINFIPSCTGSNDVQVWVASLREQVLCDTPPMGLGEMKLRSEVNNYEAFKIDASIWEQDLHSSIPGTRGKANFNSAANEY